MKNPIPSNETGEASLVLPVTPLSEIIQSTDTLQLRLVGEFLSHPVSISPKIIVNGVKYYLRQTGTVLELLGNGRPVAMKFNTHGWHTPLAAAAFAHNW